MRIIKNRRGVTLIELLISISILGIIIVSAARLYTYTLFTYSSSDTSCQVQQDARSALGLIAREVRCASAVNVINNVYEESASKSILEIIGDDVITIKWKYKSTGKKALYRIVNGKYNEIIGNVENIFFNYEENVLTVTLTTVLGNGTYTISTKVFPRKNNI